MSWLRAVLVIVCGATCAGQSLPQGQEAGPEPHSPNEISTRNPVAAIKVEVDLVLVRVVVRDPRGKVVSGLTRDDFQVFDNGKKQKVSAFSVEAAESAMAGVSVDRGPSDGKNPPGEMSSGGEASPRMAERFLALVFDDVHMKEADSIAVREAATRLFTQLAPEDRVAIYSIEGSRQQDFTSDAGLLRSAVKAMIPHRGKGTEEPRCPNITYYQADLIENKHDPDAELAAEVDARINDCPTDIHMRARAILDAGDLQTENVYRGLSEVVTRLSAMPGQRVLVYVSPGFVLTDQTGSKTWEWIERAVRQGVVVNTIDARALFTADAMSDIDAPPQAAPYRSPTIDYQRYESTFRMQAQFEAGQVLGGMAASTGGRYFHNRNDLDAAMSQALEAPQVTYLLGFAPPKPLGKFHRLKVKLAKGKKYDIEASSGYYSSNRSMNPDVNAQRDVRDALFSRDEIVGLPLRLQVASVRPDAASVQWTVLSLLDIGALRFRKAEGRNSDDLVLATGVFDKDGNLVDGQMQEIALRLEDATRQRMERTGLAFKTVFTTKPGTYRVRSVVRDSGQEQLAARNLVTTVPAKPVGGKQTKAAFQDVRWSPPNVDAPVKWLATDVECNLSEVLARSGESALALAMNLEKFTAEEHIDYVMLDSVGMVEAYDSGTFDYVYSIEQQAGGGVSREYRSPVKGSHAFPAAGQQIGGVAMALMFLPDLQSDYDMKCEGAEQRKGETDWIVHFQQRKGVRNRTAQIWVNGVARPGAFKGRAWISRENYQVVRLEGSLVDGLPDVDLQGLSVIVDYAMVQSSSGRLRWWLPDTIATYWDYEARRAILLHTFSDFQFFAVETKQNTDDPR